MNRAEQHRLIEALPHATIVSAHKARGLWHVDLIVAQGRPGDPPIRTKGKGKDFVGLLADLALCSEANQTGEPT